MAKPAKPAQDGLAEASTIDLKAGHRDRVRERFNRVGRSALPERLHCM